MADTAMEIKRLEALAADHFRNAKRLAGVVVERDARIAQLEAINKELVHTHNLMNQDGARLEGQLAQLEARCERMAGALVTAMIPIEAILLSGADAAHCQDVRDALHDAQATARQALEKDAS